jgi:hypothetical protein
VPHIVGKLLMKNTTLLHISFWSKVCTQSYGLPKLRESQFREFWDSKLGVPGQKWHLGVGPVAKHRKQYKGEAGDFPRVWAMVNFVSLCLFIAHLCTKSALTMH